MYFLDSYKLETNKNKGIIIILRSPFLIFTISLFILHKNNVIISQDLSYLSTSVTWRHTK